jgi:hypothetical protein
MSGVFARGSRHYVFVSTAHDAVYCSETNSRAFKCEGIEACLEGICKDLKC